MAKETPSQTAGPYVHLGCLPRIAGLRAMYGGQDLGTMIVGNVAAPPIFLDLTLFDGAGEVVTDAMVEIWQAGPDGGFDSMPGFRNWGRAATDFETGRVRFHTLKPGAAGDQAPHILVWIVARGVNTGLTTRVYFEDESAANADDSVYRLAGGRATTLVAKRTKDGYRHDIHLQGANETAFFDV